MKVKSLTAARTQEETIMTAVEVAARALARAYLKGRTGDDVDNLDARIQTYVGRRWRDHEAEARALLRALKDQPAHIADAGEDCLSSIGMVNAILEAMASEVCQ
jgi:hypothetical protein